MVNERRVGTGLLVLALLGCGSDAPPPDVSADGPTTSDDASSDAGRSPTDVDTDAGGDRDDAGAFTGNEDAGSSSEGWIGAWGTAPFGPFPLGIFSGGLPVDPLEITTTFPDDRAEDQSFRMIVHPTTSGDEVRVRLSNLMGDRPVTFDHVRVARRTLEAAIDGATSTPLTFGGLSEITVAPGAEAVSDGAPFDVRFGTDLAVSFHVVGKSGPITWHQVSFGINYVGLPKSGDFTADTGGLRFEQRSLGWFFLTGIDTRAANTKGTIVAIGDSITDGSFIVPGSNARWTDRLAQRLQRDGVAMGIVNQGINGNTVLPGAPPGVGPSALERFDRDVLKRPGVRTVILFEGTNDLGGGASSESVYQGLRTMIDRAHDAGVCVVLGTILPRGPFAWNYQTMEPNRRDLNARIRATTDVEGVADFEAVMAVPGQPSVPNPIYYSPDLVHPNPAGFQIMANAVPIEALVPDATKGCGRPNVVR